MYSALIESGVLSKKHGYVDVDLDTHSVPRWAKLPRTAYKPLQRDDSTKELKSIISYRSTPPWYSPGAANLPQVHGDLLALRLAAEGGDVRQVQDSWLCSLAGAAKMMLRRVGTETWYFNIGCLPTGTILFGYPAKKLDNALLDDVPLHLRLDKEHFTFAYEN